MQQGSYGGLRYIGCGPLPITVVFTKVYRFPPTVHGFESWERSLLLGGGHTQCVYIHVEYLYIIAYTYIYIININIYVLPNWRLREKNNQIASLHHR